MRLDKRITALGLTRAQAKRLIARGEVRVNGEVERDAGRIVTDADEVRAQGTAAAAAGHTHLMLFKPAGVLTATRDGRETTVLDLIPAPPRGLGPVGRLDKDSEGLLLFTNDGDLMQRLIHPKFEVSKLYRVTVQGDWRRGIPQLQTMDTLEGEPIAPAQVELGREMGESAVLLITIHQGKNRQIRRMCRQAGLTVTRLERIAEHGIYLADLPCGKWRALTEEERMRLKESEKK